MGRSGGKKLKNKTVTRVKHLQGENLKQMTAKFDGVDKITGQKISAGDKIFYNKDLKEAYSGSNPFAAAGRGGAALQEMFMAREATDPIGLVGVFLLLKERGVPLDELNNDSGIILSELDRWSIFINPEKANNLPTPSALMLIDALEGREDLRSRLESELSHPFEQEEDYQSKDPELDAALKKLLGDLKNIGDPRDFYSRRASCWWTDFGAISVYSKPGMAARRALRDLDLDAFRRQSVAGKLMQS